VQFACQRERASDEPKVVNTAQMLATPRACVMDGGGRIAVR
jgi:hypothetical protein